MNATLPPPVRRPVEIGFRRRPAWLLVLLGLLVAQGAAALTLFGRGPAAWRPLLSDQPLVGGRHPLHLYHGYLGSQSWRARGSACCYDPAFQAGYPKTPLFDRGSRPAELALALAGGGYRPAVYKLGLAICLLLVPLALAFAARGLGLGPGWACLAAALGQLVGWGGPVRELVEAGDLDFLLGGLLLLVHLSALAWFHHGYGAIAWLALLATTALGWFVHPLLFASCVPAVLLFQLAMLGRHGLGWHLALLLAWGVGLVGNLGCLLDWPRYWWVRLPLAEGPAVPGGFADWWRADLWGGPTDRLRTAVLLGGGTLGVGSLLLRRQWVAAGLSGVGLLGVTAAGSTGVFWPVLDQLGSAHLFAIAPWFAVVPFVFVLSEVGRLLARRGRPGQAAVGLFALACGAVLVEAGQRTIAELEEALPLPVGLNAERRAVVCQVAENTTPAARVLWEDRTDGRGDRRWTALLPLLTERSYLGGLGPEANVEHGFAGLCAGVLAGRPMAEWSDAELADFCRRYNVGWVVCWTPAAVQRFGAWPLARPVVSVRDDGGGWLFAIDRPHAFVLKGRAEIVQADWERIALRDVVPEDGEVVLSLHYQSGWRVAPRSVWCEEKRDEYDPVPFLRLKLARPVSRLTLVWGGP